MDVEESTPLLNTPRQKRFQKREISLANVLIAFWVFIFNIYQFLMFDWNSKDGEYPFLLSNAFVVIYTFSSACCYMAAKANGEDPLKFLKRKLFLRFVPPSMALALGNIMQMTAVASTGPQVVSVIAFARIVFTSLFQIMFKGLRPSRLVGSVLVAIVWFVFVYLYIVITTVQQATIQGSLLSFAAYLCFEFRAVLGGQLIGTVDAPMLSLLFVQYVSMIPCYAVCIPLEQLIHGFSIYDYVPGHGFTLKSLVLLPGMFLGDLSQILTSAWDVSWYIGSTYAGQLACVVVADAIENFKGFDPVSFAIACGIAWLALTYIYSSTMIQQLRRLKPFDRVLKTYRQSRNQQDTLSDEDIKNLVSNMNASPLVQGKPYDGQWT